VISLFCFLFLLGAAQRTALVMSKPAAVRKVAESWKIFARLGIGSLILSGLVTP
jgi:putative copper export protein